MVQFNLLKAFAKIGSRSARVLRSAYFPITLPFKNSLSMFITGGGWGASVAASGVACFCVAGVAVRLSSGCVWRQRPRRVRVGHSLAFAIVSGDGDG